MGLFGLDNVLPSPLKGLVAQYRRLRPTRLRLNNELSGGLSNDVITDGANRIGMLQGGTLVFESEQELAVLMDYCIYDVRRRGRNAVEQYLCDRPPAADSDEMACLHAMQHATYAMLAVVRVERGVGCHVRNLFTEETRLLVDLGFSQTAQRGAVMAARLLDFGDYICTTGAALPLGILDEDKLEHFQREFLEVFDTDCTDPATLIQMCLQHGASSHIRYEDTDERRLDIGGGTIRMPHSSLERRAHAKRRKSKPAANRRCRCGSGKMVKNCCGKR